MEGLGASTAGTTGSDPPNAVDVLNRTDANGTREGSQGGEKTAEFSNRERSGKDNGVDIVPHYKGVQWDRKNNRWRARLHTDRTRHVGYFSTEEDAGRAWDQALLRYTCGEDTIKKLNFPEESFAKFKEFISHEGDFDGFDLRGVVKIDAQPGKFSAYIVQNRQQINIGTFPTAREAAIAYDWKSIQCFGWGSLTNFPLANYEIEYIRNGGLCPLDRSMLPTFPNHKRFADGDKTGAVYNAPETSQTKRSKRGRLEQQQGIVPGVFPGAAAQMPQLDPKFAQLLQQSGINFNFHPLLQYPGRPPVGQVGAGTSPVQQVMPVHPEPVVEVAENQWKSSVNADLGLYNSNELAKDAVDRAKLSVNGYSSVAPDELIKHLHHIEATKNQLEHKIKDKGGLFYITLHIHSRGFELGPYKTVDQARMAHDKYALLIDGGKAQTFNPLIDILLESEEAKNLLGALGVDSQPAPPVVNANAQVPQSSILANAYTTTLRKVASQASLQEEGQEFTKQLEKIESSIEGIQAVSKQQMSTTDAVQGLANPTSCPLPPFPQKSPSNIEHNDT